jgi:hypothetical protein
MLVRKNNPKTFRLPFRDVWKLRRYPLEYAVRFVVIRYLRWLYDQELGYCNECLSEVIVSLGHFEATPMAACRHAAAELLEERPWA